MTYVRVQPWWLVVMAYAVGAAVLAALLPGMKAYSARHYLFRPTARGRGFMRY